MKDNKIHIAYGFHVNCYHSYRGDSNDNLGFGSDIRIINKILDILTDLNEKGIPVKGTWDSENFFSLEKILPEYAPEIIEKMKSRVIKYGDENIIMGYNNGALSAMNEEEFTASIELAVSNASGSGLVDIFGECEKIVRPQEVMFTPSQVSLYNKLGVKALCLYYSCVPFDAFRTIVPRLDDEAAFNPLTYTYKGESMVILPTYNNSDICDAGCLRAWVKELHSKQASGEINNDMLIFINMDADAIFWEPLNLGPLSNKIANTVGIKGLVEEIADLPFIVFDTPGGYLKNHKPVGKIEFTQDTADGNFTGYASWSEKPFNRRIWTDIERARAMAKVNAKSDDKSPSFDDRVLLLSTTHFGLATPVLNIQREKTALELADKIIEEEKSSLPSTKRLTIHNINNSTLQCVQLKIGQDVDDISYIQVKSPDLDNWAIVKINDDSAYAMLKFKEVKKKYALTLSLAKPKEKNELDYVLKSDSLEIRFSRREYNIYSVISNGEEIGDQDFLKSFITYDGNEYRFEKKSIEAINGAGDVKGLEISGEIHLPNEIKAGYFKYIFFSVPFSKGIFVGASIEYPLTKEDTSISTENSALGRYSDMKWTEVVPFQITPKLKGDISVIKRNFMNDISSFRTQSFPECDSRNKKLYSFNHQLTAGMVGITDNNAGIIIANARQVLNSMAHCPMRLEEDKTVRLNPFGTYYGKQRHHWSRAKGQILETYTLVTPQGKSIAPSYNGNKETYILGLFPAECINIGEDDLLEITSFADGCVATGDNDILSPYYEQNVIIKDANADTTNEKDLMSPILTGINGNLGKYITKGAKAIGHIIYQQIKAKN